ncbi:uncharacterized protein ACN2A1_000477 [Glossina fuscipes fuscipes]
MFPKLLNASKINVLSLLWLVGSLLPLANADRFADCDYYQETKEPSSFIVKSPNFPELYPPHSSCRYKLVAPLDYVISANCTIYIDQGHGDCSDGYLLITRTDELHSRSSERFCGTGSFARQSFSGSVEVCYVSNRSRGRFQCQLQAAPQD